MIKLLIAAAFAAAPLAAGAVTVVPGGGPYALSNAPFEYNQEFEAGPSGMLTFSFVNDSATNSVFTVAVPTINQYDDGRGGLQDYYFTGGVDVTFGDAMRSLAQGEVASFQLSQMVDAGGIVDLIFEYGAPIVSGDTGPQIDFRVLSTTTPIPLPAAAGS